MNADIFACSVITLGSIFLVLGILRQWRSTGQHATKLILVGAAILILGSAIAQLYLIEDAQNGKLMADLFASGDPHQVAEGVALAIGLLCISIALHMRSRVTSSSGKLCLWLILFGSAIILAPDLMGWLLQMIFRPWNTNFALATSIAITMN